MAERIYSQRLDDGRLIEATYQQARRRITAMMETPATRAKIEFYLENFRNKDAAPEINHIWGKCANELHVLEHFCWEHDPSYKFIIAL